MAWVRLDDNFHWHDKVAPLSDAAYRLYVGALCYCNRFNRAGLIRLHEVVGICPDLKNRKRTIAELVQAGLWDIHPKGWTIHDYFAYQPDPKKQAAGRASAQQRVQQTAQQVFNTRSTPVPVPDPVPVEKNLSDSRITDGSRVLTRPNRGTLRAGESDKLIDLLPRVTA